MKSCFKPIKRRKFLKTGVTGGAFIVTLPLWKLISFSASVSDCHNRPDGYFIEQSQEKILNIALKHGGEFAEIKPELRRNGYGRI